MPYYLNQIGELCFGFKSHPLFCLQPFSKKTHNTLFKEILLSIYFKAKFTVPVCSTNLLKTFCEFCSGKKQDKGRKSFLTAEGTISFKKHVMLPRLRAM